MARGGVIEIALRLKDSFSKGIVTAAKEARKAGANISNDMLYATKTVNRWKDNTISAIDGVVKRLGALTIAGAGAFAAMSFDVGMNFEAGLSQVQATGQFALDTMKRLEAKALEVAATTKFTPGEVAEGLNYMLWLASVKRL